MLRDIYTMFLTYHHILPDEVGRQNPWVLFKMLDGLNEDTEDYDNEHLRMFYKCFGNGTKCTCYT